MKTKSSRLEWQVKKSSNKEVEKELKRRAKSLLNYAVDHKIGYLMITVIGDNYSNIMAKKDVETNDYVLDSYAFTKEHNNE